jgi:hypothetical protein
MIKTSHVTCFKVFGGAVMDEGLIAYLQKYADDLEAEAGAPDPEIRAKIAELKVFVLLESGNALD